MDTDQNSHRHVVILGGGLAGTLMAARLCMAGARVTLVDDRNPAAASRVAAGLYNVITGKAGKLTWMAMPFVEALNAFFAQPEFAALARYRYPLSIYRPFHDPEDYNTWLSRSVEENYSPWVEFQETPHLPTHIHNPHGGIWIKGCGYVQIGPFIDALQRQLEMTHHLRRLTGHLDPEEIDLENRTIQLRAERLTFSDIVFTTGYQLAQYAPFIGLPIRPNKGETLLVERSDGGVLPRHIVVRKGYYLPVSSGQLVVGSTYENRYEEAGPTEVGRRVLMEKLQAVLPGEYRVVKHQAGIRPTSPDRKPIVGRHPALDYVYTLAGLGTKGLLASPFFSTALAKVLLEGVDDATYLTAEVQLRRYWSGDQFVGKRQPIAPA